MGFFKKLFGAEPDKPAEPAAAPNVAEAPAPPKPTDGGPYRGADFVMVKPEAPKAQVPHPPAMWDSWTEVFSIELGDALPLRSLVYCGETKDDRYLVRRIAFADGGVVVDWEVALPNRDALSDHLVCRVDDQIIVPRATGFVVVHVVTGEPCWELRHPAAMHKRPVRFADGDLLFVFADQSWMRLSPADGSCRAEGTVRSDRDMETLKRDCRELTTQIRGSARYGGRAVDVGSNEIRVSPHGDGPETPPGPTVGEYPIDDWNGGEWATLVGDRLAVRLTRSWNDRTRVAIGLFEPTSLEPLRLLELGDVVWHGDKAGHIIDGLLLVEAELIEEGGGMMSNDYDALFVVDTHAEHVVACFNEDRPSHLFDANGRRVWESAL